MVRQIEQCLPVVSVFLVFPITSVIHHFDAAIIHSTARMQLSTIACVHFLNVPTSYMHFECIVMTILLKAETEAISESGP